MRSHSTWGSPDKEPWAFDYNHEIINKHAIELRYELLPYIYNAMQRASQTGVPALRPLFLEYPDDAKVTGLDDEFLFGHDLLVVPVLYEGANEREVYLPQGEWFDYWTGRCFAGGQTIHLTATAEIDTPVRARRWFYLPLTSRPEHRRNARKTAACPHRSSKRV